MNEDVLPTAGARPLVAALQSATTGRGFTERDHWSRLYGARPLVAALQGTGDRLVFDLMWLATDNLLMPATKQPAKKASKPKAKASANQLSNTYLLKLAAKNRQPQCWYDESVDPTRPAASNGRGK